jgi:hypothetical protein
MARKHALFISLAVAAALVAGTFAALRTTELGASAATPAVSEAQISARDRQLDRIQTRLERQARKRPPRLSAVRTPAGPSGGVAALVSSSSGPSGGGSHEDDGHSDDHGHHDDDVRFDDHDRHEDDRSGHGGGDDERGHD